MTNIAEELYGKGPEGLSRHPVEAVPWPAAGRLRTYGDYDKSVVNAAVKDPSSHMSEIDPRTLSATQSHLVPATVREYLTGDSHGPIHDSNQAGNKTPVVYRRPPSPLNPNGKSENLILSGHHRAAAALLRGEQFNAIVVQGPWGAKR